MFCIILHILRRPNSIIVLLFTQNIGASLLSRILFGWPVFCTVSGYKHKFILHILPKK